MSFLGEIKRRKVFQVTAVYAVVAWLTIQIVDVVSEPLSLPDWLDTVVIILLLVGFPIAVVLAWAFDLTPDGVVRDHGTKTVTRGHGRRIEYTLIGLLVVAVGWIGFRELNPPDSDARIAFPNSVAVLPFDNRSAQADDEFFVAGIHDDILTQLSRITSLKVISRTSVMGYEDTDKNLRTIGEELGVAAILEGGVQRAGNTIRINVQLIDAESDSHLWAEVYDRELTAENVFAIQSEMAVSIANALEATLTPQDVARLNDVPTQNTRAYEFYLSGKQYEIQTQLDYSSIALAIQQYGRAVAEDPEFALAFAALSIQHIGMYWYGVDRSDERRRMARNAVDRALEINPDLPEAHHAMGRYHYHGFRDYADALRELEIAEQGMPSDSELLATRSFIHKRLGEWDRALAAMERALDSDPRNTNNWMEFGWMYLLLRDYTAGEEALNRVLDIQPDAIRVSLYIATIPLVRDGDTTAMHDPNLDLPVDTSDLVPKWLPALYDRDYASAHRIFDELPGDEVEYQYAIHYRASVRGLAYRLAGQAELALPQFELARLQIETALQGSPDDYRLYIAFGEVLAGLGEREAATRAAERALEMMPPSLDAETGRTIQQQAVKRVLIPAGAYDRALGILDEYLSVPGWVWSIEGLLPDPRLDPIRDDPRFQALVEKYKRQ